jgi:aldehyde:ferredoxin oxidoreductase
VKPPAISPHTKLAAKNIQHHTYLKEMLGLCDWGYPISYSLNTPDHMGDPEIEAKICNAVTGIGGEELDTYAERVYNLQRLILLREGRKTPEADYPMEFNFTEPLKSMAVSIMVPGPGDSAVDMTGNKLDKGKYTAMLKEYYRLRGWDEETGLPLPGTLAELGLADCSAEKVT